MQKYFAGELRPDQKKSWKADDGIFYLVSDIAPLLIAVEEFTKEKEGEISALKAELFAARQALFSEARGRVRK